MDLVSRLRLDRVYFFLVSGGTVGIGANSLVSAAAADDGRGIVKSFFTRLDAAPVSRILVFLEVRFLLSSFVGVMTAGLCSLVKATGGGCLNDAPCRVLSIGCGCGGGCGGDGDDNSEMMCFISFDIVCRFSNCFLSLSEKKDPSLSCLVKT
jgi:hypothetical protein